MRICPHRGKRKEKVGKVSGLKKGSCSVMASKCYCYARSGWGFGYGDDELTKESLGNTSVFKNGISTECGITWKRKNFAKSS